MRVLGLVPARGGSKGIPGKNIKPLAGKPLLAYTAETALQSRLLDRIVLSTDSEEIAAVGRRYGLDVPFLRPAELAADASPTLPVVRHALEWYAARGERFDALCLLQPTTPFRKTADIDGCVRLLAESDADAVVSVTQVPDEFNPHWVYFRGADGSIGVSTGEAAPIPRRQELPPSFHRDGSLYVTRTRVLLEQNSLYGDRVLGYVTAGGGVNLDTPEDWARAEALAATAEAAVA
ncbi:MAG: acylneuraminate cytidylyltransferase family protein [Bryobacterales bacterium]